MLQGDAWRPGVAQRNALLPDWAERNDVVLGVAWEGGSLNRQDCSHLVFYGGRAADTALPAGGVTSQVKA